MAYRLVIFDFDDTLLHLDVDWKAVKADIVKLAREAGVKVDESQNLVPLGNRLSAHHGLKDKVDGIYLKHETICAERRAYTPFSQILDIARELKVKGLKTGIASGNHTDSIKRILSDLGILDSFDVICGRDAVARSKPAPDQLLLIMEKTGVKMGEVIFVGDSMHDRLSAKAAGIYLFLVHPNSSYDATRLRHELGLGSS
ncbi:MAG: HAD-IA family hydrolase [Candidatus Micrarchaeota archaeon]